MKTINITDREVLQDPEVQEFIGKIKWDYQNTKTSTPYFLYIHLDEDVSRTTLGIKFCQFHLVPADQLPWDLTDATFVSEVEKLIGATGDSQLHGSMLAYQDFESKEVSPLRMLTPKQPEEVSGEEVSELNTVSTITVDNMDLMTGDCFFFASVNETGKIRPIYGIDVLTKMIGLVNEKQKDLYRFILRGILNRLGLPMDEEDN